MCGPRDNAVRILTGGGFSSSDANSMLDRLVADGAALSAIVPAGSTERLRVDPDTLAGRDLDGMTEPVSVRDAAEAMPILAAGRFEMPEMPGLREILRRRRASHEEDPSP